jgi:uncharacterized protein YndB with AHSA1/START domain
VNASDAAGAPWPRGAEESGDSVVLRRVYAAPRSAVFRAWTEAEALKRWWAPAGGTTPHCTVDLRPGGHFHFCMSFTPGPEIWGLGVYREVVPGERLVYDDSFADAEGNPVPPTHYGFSAEHPEVTRVTVTFADHPGGTEVTLRHAFPAAVHERAGTEQGWREMLDRLDQVLAEG